MQLCFKACFISIWTKASHTLEVETMQTPFRHWYEKKVPLKKRTLFCTFYLILRISSFDFYFTLSFICDFVLLIILLRDTLYFHKGYRSDDTVISNNTHGCTEASICLVWNIYFSKEVGFYFFFCCCGYFCLHNFGKTTSENECGVKYALIYEIGLSMKAGDCDSRQFIKVLS